VRIDEIRISNRYRKDLGDLVPLCQSIEQIGLLHPIVINPENELIAGQRRLAACKTLGWKEIAVFVVDIKEIVRGEHDENVMRKDFLPSEKVAIGEALWPEEYKAGQERKRSGLKRGSEWPDRKNVPNGKKGKTQDRIAAHVGMSSPTYGRAKAIIQLGKRQGLSQKERRLVEEAKKEMDTTGKVSAAHRKIKHLLKPMTKQERIKEIARLAAGGHRANQIANKIYVTVEHTRLLARQNNISLPDIGRDPKFDANKIVEETVIDAQSIVAGLKILAFDPTSLDKTKLPGWVDSLEDSLKTLGRMLTTLKREMNP